MNQGNALQPESQTAAASKPKLFAGFFRRRRYIVDGRFQGMLILAFLLHTTVFAMILACALFVPTILTIRGADPESMTLLRASREMLALDARFWPALGAALVLSFLLALHTSHRIAGPLYRFRRVFEALLRRENPGPVRLRKRDYLKPEAEFLERVSESIVQDRARLANLEQSIRLALDELEGLDHPIEELDAARERLARALLAGPSDDEEA